MYYLHNASYKLSATWKFWFFYVKLFFFKDHIHLFERQVRAWEGEREAEGEGQAVSPSRGSPGRAGSQDSRSPGPQDPKTT